jgi:hypothetical protein
MIAQRDDWIGSEEYLQIDCESQDIKYEYVDGQMYGSIDSLAPARR